MKPRNHPLPDTLPYDIRRAFPPMPASCMDALTRAARSVKEEKAAARVLPRAVLIAAAILLLTLAMALAAGQLGLIDLFSPAAGTDARLPGGAQNVLSATEQQTYAAGPLSVTLRETLCDGRIAYLTALCSPASGSALILSGNDDISSPLPAGEARRLGVPEGLSFMDAAARAGVPLYTVTAWLEINWDYRAGDEMMNALWDADGGMLAVDMLTLNAARISGDALPARFMALARRIDPLTGNHAEGEEWRISQDITLPINGVTERKTYLPAGDNMLCGIAVNSVRAEKTCAGVYLSAALTLPEALAARDAQASGAARSTVYEWLYTDARGVPLPGGISLTGGLDDSAWPNVVLHTMIGTDALPGELHLYSEKTGASILLQ